MKISYRAKRNFQFALCILGILLIAARAWQVAMDPTSGKGWFDLFGIVLLTSFCFSRYRTLRHIAAQKE